HASLKAGGPCPDARCRGKVYPQRDPGVLVRVKGQAPIAATVYELGKLRCNLCGDVFTAAAPEGVGEKKYDETAASMIALLRYGSGVPRLMNRSPICAPHSGSCKTKSSCDEEWNSSLP